MCDRCYANLVFTVNTEGVMQLIMLKQFGGWGGGSTTHLPRHLFMLRAFSLGLHIERCRLCANKVGPKRCFWISLVWAMRRVLQRY